MKRFIFLIIILFGCKNAQVSNGIYKLDELNNCSITITKDRFKYYCINHMSYCISEGYYKIKINKIYLFSDEEFNYGIISSSQSSNPNLKIGIIKIKVEDLDGYPYFATIKIEKRGKVFFYETDPEGFITFDSNLISGDIFLTAVGLNNETGVLLELDKNNNYYEIKIKPHNYKNCYFEKKEFKIKENTLIDLSSRQKYKLIKPR